MYRYAKCVDQARWGDLQELFADAVVRANTSEDVATGGEAIAALWSAVNKVHPDGTLRTRHLITNIVIDLDEEADEATAESYFMVFQATDQVPLQPIAGGRYFDTFRRRNGIWAFAVKDIQVDQTGNVSDHLTVSLDEPVRFGA